MQPIMTFLEDLTLICETAQMFFKVIVCLVSDAMHGVNHMMVFRKSATDHDAG